MMAHKDITTKKILKHIVKDIARYIFKIELEDAEILETEYQRVEERRADLVIQARQGKRVFILHIEIQNNNQTTMPLRMLRYYTDIALAYPDIHEIEQYLIYIGKAPLTMPDGINKNHHRYHYYLIDMHHIDCAVFLNDNNPHAVVLAILCDFKGRDKRTMIRTLLLRIAQLTQDNSTQYQNCLLALEILSENRDLKQLVKEEEQMLSNIKLENLPSYEIAFERGEAQAQAKAQAESEAKITRIIQKMLSIFDDQKIHDITGVELSIIHTIRANKH